jgi:hypothetical protein
MDPPAVGLEVGHDFKGRDLCIESLGILQVVVPILVNNVAEEFGNPTVETRDYQLCHYDVIVT